MSIIAIIPARYDSSRFPGKPLAIINGKSMIQRVYEQAVKVSFIDKIVVATDDDRILDHCKSVGVNAVMTAKKHRNGTERITEVVNSESQNFDYILNIQGDEPFVNIQQIESLCKLISSDKFQIATLAKAIDDEQEMNSNNTVKVVMTKGGKALYFSRYAIPFMRNDLEIEHYKHVGMYAFKREALLQISKLKPSGLESAESLEQLRWLENDMSIGIEKTTFESFGIDTPEDIVNALKKLNITI